MLDCHHYGVGRFRKLASVFRSLRFVKGKGLGRCTITRAFTQVVSHGMHNDKKSWFGKRMHSIINDWLMMRIEVNCLWSGRVSICQKRGCQQTRWRARNQNPNAAHDAACYLCVTASPGFYASRLSSHHLFVSLNLHLTCSSRCRTRWCVYRRYSISRDLILHQYSSSPLSSRSRCDFFLSSSWLSPPVQMSFMRR